MSNEKPKEKAKKEPKKNSKAVNANAAEDLKNHPKFAKFKKGA